MYLPNIYIPIANADFFEKSYFEFRAAIFETYRPSFRTLCLALFLAKPYYQKVRIDPGIILGFWSKS